MYRRGDLSENAILFEVLNLDHRGSLSNRAVQLFGIGPGSFLNEVIQLTLSIHIFGVEIFRCDDRANVCTRACHVLLNCLVCALIYF